MSWRSLHVSPCGTHHIHEDGQVAYEECFDEVHKFHPPGLAPVHRGGQAWHIQDDGSPAYDRRFVRTFGFYEGLASVIASDGWCHITPDGQDAYPGRHAWSGNFLQGRCAVRDDDGAYYHITPAGNVVYPERWRYAGDYRDGLAVVQAGDGHSTHIDLDGKLVHGRWFVDLDVFHKGFARARDDEGWMHVDLQGRPGYMRRFQAVEPFYNGQARVECFDGALEIIDESGATMVTLRPPRRSEFAELSAYMVGFWRTQTIGAAVELGVIEALPATESEVTDLCRLRNDGAGRLLRALGEMGIVARNANHWALTQRGEFLRADHPLTLADAAIEYAGPFSEMWGQLPEALRRNSTWNAPDVFDEVAHDEMRCVGHHRMLRSYARHDYAEISRALQLRGNERVVDAGGGFGTLAQLVLAAHPLTQVTVLERPEVVAMAQTLTPGLEWRRGNLFEPWGLDADAVILSRVLHDWDDAEAIQILKHAHAVLPPGGQLYIVEMLLSEEGLAGSLCDLHLLMATGGRERSAAQFRRLLAQAGFECTAVQRLAALPTLIVGCRHD